MFRESFGKVSGKCRESVAVPVDLGVELYFISDSGFLFQTGGVLRNMESNIIIIITLRRSK